MLRRTAPVLMLLFLAACATQAPQLPVPEPEEPQDVEIVAPPLPEPAAAEPPLDDRLLFHVLTGELAGNQGDLRQSLQAYLEAARLSDDPRLAEQAARLALYLHEHAAALEAAERWLRAAPDDPAPHEVLALTLLRSERPDEARDHLRAVIRLHPGGVGSALERIAGLLGRETGVSRELALAVMQQLVAAHDREPQAQQALAQLALQLDQPALALAAAERAKALSPNWAAPDLLRVQALLKSGEGDEAVGLLGALLKRRPNDHDLRLQYARTLLSLEQTEGALKQFELLLKARPQAAQFRYVAALLALELGEHDKARRYLLQLVNTGQYADDAYFYLGRLAQAEGDAKGAMRWYRQVQGAQRPDAVLRLAALLAEQGQPDAARKQLQDLRLQYPQQAAQSYLAEAGLLRWLGRPQEALALYEQALAQFPDHAELRYARALTAATLGDVPTAEQDLRQLLAQAPDDPQYLNALGYTLVDQTTRYLEGYELVERAYALRPDDPAIMDSMGWALFRLQRLDEARVLLEQAYAASQDGEIAAHLAEVLWQLGERQQARQILADALKREPSHRILLDTKSRLQ